MSPDSGYQHIVMDNAKPETTSTVQ